MKTILAPIDYSEVSNNALDYAAELAAFTNAKLVLLHAYHIPLPTGDAPILMISPKDVEEENKQAIKKAEKRIQKITGGKIKVESIAHEGFATDAILNVAKEKNADLIVMGITGAGKIAQAVIGSVSTAVMKKANIPVLIIPAKATFSEAKKIVYACDYEKIENHSALEPMWELAHIFGSEIMVFNVKDSRVQPTTKEAIEGIKLDHWLGRVKHSYWFSENRDIAEAINDFAKKNKAVMVAMVARKHSFPENLIHKSITKQMAFNTQMPLLSIHE